jgi:hypothetical protein
MKPRRLIQYFIAALTLVLYGYVLYAYVARGNLSWLTPLVVLLGLYLADAASGVAHFVVDYTPNVPGVGLKELFEYEGDKGSADYVKRREAAMKRINAFHEVVFDFKVHHLSPDTLGRRSFAKMTLPVVVFGALPLTSVVVLLGELTPLPADLLLLGAILIGCGTISQYAHSCTHKKRPNALVRALQATRLFLRKETHQVHHDNPERQFCLLNGWANPLIDRVFRVVFARGYLKPNGLEVV